MDFNYDFQLLPQYLEKLMVRLRLAVIYGGDKNRSGAVIYRTHNPRSTKSYEAVAHDIAGALKNVGFQQVWTLPDDMSLAPRLQELGIHLAWLNTGGVQGYNPVCHTPALLEMLGVPYIGHNPLNSSILDNKHAFKRELQGLGFPTAPFLIWHTAQGKFRAEDNPRFQAIFGDYGGPWVVKPVSGRASLNVYVVDTLAELSEAIALVHQTTRNTALIETYLGGPEYCVSVCGYVLFINQQFQKRSLPFAFSTIERVLETDEKIFTSMDHKAITRERMRLLTNDAADVKAQLISLAQQIYWDFNLNSLVRIDLRADSQGKLQILEANPKPDLKRPQENVTSLVAQGLLEYGMNYDDFILSLLCDRLDYLFTYHRAIIPHLLELLD